MLADCVRCIGSIILFAAFLYVGLSWAQGK